MTIFFRVSLFIIYCFFFLQNPPLKEAGTKPKWNPIQIETDIVNSYIHPAMTKKMNPKYEI